MKRVYFLLLFVICAQLLFSQCIGSASHFLETSHIKVAHSTSGFFWANIENYDDAFRIPKSETRSVVFMGGLWFGGASSATGINVAASTYGQSGYDFFVGTYPGDSNTCAFYDQIFDMSKNKVNAHLSLAASYPSSAIPPSLINHDILIWPAKGNQYVFTNFGVNINENLAPFIDVNGNGIYEPDRGDYPDIKGDVANFWVMNDAMGPHNESNSDSMLLQFNIMAYAFETGETDAIFYDVAVRNKSTVNYVNCYQGIFADPEILTPFDNNYVGCDTINEVGYGYAGLTDTIGLNSPIFCVDVLCFSKENQFSSCIYFDNDFSINGNPIIRYDYYHYLMGENKAGPVYKDGSQVKYFYPGNPSDFSTWTGCSDSTTWPSDKRFVMSNGPFDFNAGQSYAFSFAAYPLYIPSSQYPCPDIKSVLDVKASAVQSFYESLSGSCNDFGVGINEALQYKDNEIEIFPNPVSNQLYINCSENLSIAIYDKLGKTILSTSINRGRNSIDVSQLQSGVYYFCSKNQSSKLLFVKL